MDIPASAEQSAALINKIEIMAKAIRREIVRQYRDDDRGRCSAGAQFWEEEIQPLLLAAAAIDAAMDQNREL